MFRVVSQTEWSRDAAAGGWTIELAVPAGAAQLDLSADWHGSTWSGEASVQCTPTAAAATARVGSAVVVRAGINRPAPRALRIRVPSPPPLLIWRLGPATPAARFARRSLCRTLDSRHRHLEQPVDPAAARARVAGGDLDEALGEFAQAWLSGQPAVAMTIARDAMAYAATHPLVRSPKLGAMIGALAGYAESE
jgi:hypothetical protein